MPTRGVLRTGNAELDRVTGGIPFPSLNLIEGENDSGKSILVQHIAWGGLEDGYTVRYITTETTARSLINHMKSISLDVTPYFIKGLFKVTVLHVKGVRWSERVAKHYLRAVLHYIKNKGFADVIIIDSLTYIATHANANDLLLFLSELRNLVDSRETVVIVTIHPYAFSADLLVRIRSICDGHILLSIKVLPNKEIVRVLEVAKLKGARKSTDNVVFFNVDPAFGIRIVPVSRVKASG